MADDFAGVPVTHWLDLEDRVRGQGVLLMILFCVILALVVLLNRKGILTAADLIRPGDG
jgi:hypothetical protein